MIPIRATYHYEEKVEVDYEKEDHMDFVNEPYAIEKKMISGWIIEILRLKDSGIEKVIVDKEVSNIPVTADGVYALFLADRDTHYEMVIDGYFKFTVSNKNMRDYIQRLYSNDR